MYTTRIITSINEIDEDSWDSLISDNIFFHKWKWFKLIEASFDYLVPRHILVYENSRLIATAACFIQYDYSFPTIDNVLFGDILDWLNKISGLKFSLLPIVVCFSPYSDFDGLILKCKKNEKVVCCILSVLDRICRENRITISMIYNIHHSDTQLIHCLRKRGYAGIVSEPVADLNCPWKSFDNYLDSLEGYERKKIRKELRKNKAAGVTFRNEEITSDSLKTFVTLYKNVFKKYNPYRLFFAESFFINICETFKDSLELRVAENSAGDIIGAALNITTPTTIYAYKIGMKYNQTKDNFTYFVLAFYDMITHAINKNITNIYYGKTNYISKKRVGCTFHQKSYYIKFQNHFVHKLFSPYIAGINLKKTVQLRKVGVIIEDG